MKASLSGKSRVGNAAPLPKRHRAALYGRRMRDVPNVDMSDDVDLGPEASAIDVLGAELCHQIARDVAEARPGDGVDADWDDPEDWLQAEADGAHLLQKPGRG